MSFANDLLFPLSAISRRKMVSSSKSTSYCLNKVFKSLLTLKVPSITHFFSPLRITAESARAPNSNCSASNIIDLPAPVSPVITDKPLVNSNLSSLISTKFLMVSCFNMRIKNRKKDYTLGICFIFTT